MTALAVLRFARAELGYWWCMAALRGLRGREAIGEMLRLYRAVEYWDVRRARNRVRT